MDNLIIREITPEELKQIATEYRFEEDKQATVKAMFEMLKTTRAFNGNLQDMTYVKHSNGDESVECFFKYRSGHEEVMSVNVTCDSCVSLIQDVWKRMYELI